MTRAILAGCLIVLTLGYSFAYGALRTLTDDDWPDIDE